MSAINYTHDDAYEDGFRDGERNMAGDIAELKRDCATLRAALESFCDDCDAGNLVFRGYIEPETREAARAALARCNHE